MAILVVNDNYDDDLGIICTGNSLLLLNSVSIYFISLSSGTRLTNKQFLESS